MLIRAPAIICASRAHGEHGAVVRLLTADHGLIAGYVAGARGRTLRPVLIPGNLVAAELNARTMSQLPSAKLELVTSRGPWLGEPLASAGIGWVTTLTAQSLPEGQPFPGIHGALEAVLDAICHAPRRAAGPVPSPPMKRCCCRRSAMAMPSRRRPKNHGKACSPGSTGRAFPSRSTCLPIRAAMVWRRAPS